MIGTYILNERGEPVSEPTFLKWARWFETADRQVGDELVDGARVSTVFLGVDQGFYDVRERAPILWETMVFGGPFNGEQMRCAGSREQAEAMHAWMVARVRRTNEAWAH